MRRLAVILLLSLPSLALAHSWYDWECCHNNDCAPVRAETVRAGKGGYTVTLQPGEHPLVKAAPLSGFVAYPEARHSQDGRYHVCVVAGAIKCLYTPPGGV